MNNTGILQKCLTELSQDPARLDYVRGMLETLIEMQEHPLIITKNPASNPSWTNVTNSSTTDLPPLPDLTKIKDIASQSLA